MNVIKKITLTTLYAIIYTSAMAQISGYVREQGEGAPLEYVTVACLNASGSAIGGALTDSLGYFNISQATIEDSLRFSIVGYKTKTISVVQSGSVDTVYLERDNTVLGEVVVHGKQIVQTPNGFVVTINDVLKQLGTARNVLGHIPFVTTKNGSISVIGKGNPVIYINDRQMRNATELDQINSSDIKQVEVITNPGAEYASSVNSVIRIRTVKRKGYGFGSRVDAEVSKERKWSYNGGISLNYQTRRDVNFFASVRYNRNDEKYSIKQNLNYWRQQEINQTANEDLHGTTWYSTVGFDYQKDKASFGAMYRYTYDPTHALGNDSFSVYRNGDFHLSQSYRDRRNITEGTHYVNAYMNDDFSKDTHLKLDADYMNVKAPRSQEYVMGNEGLYTNSQSRSQLYADRITFLSALFGGTVTVGEESSYTHTRNNYNVLSTTTLTTDLTSNHTRSRQLLLAVFVDYKHRLGKFLDASIGGRYEHANFDDYINGIKDPAASRRDNNFFPSTSISYSGKDIQMSLAYRYTTIRPIYFYLRSSVEYDSPYFYATGNPSLLPQTTNLISYSFFWKNLQFTANYYMHKNSTVFTMDRYLDRDSIVLSSPENIRHNQTLDLALVFSPTWFSIWSPQFTLDFNKPFMTYHGTSYRKPILSFEFDNTVQLPLHFLFGLDMNMSTSGNISTDLEYNYKSFQLDTYLIKTFFNDRIKLRFSVDNVLNINHTRLLRSTNNIDMRQWYNNNRRTFRLSFSYEINPTKKKYKGQASTNEINRL